MTEKTNKYELTDIMVDKEIDEIFKCGICFDILKSPILCGGGHSWCLDCIKKNNKKICPICPKSIDHNNPAPNFIAKTLIDKMICRCSNRVNDLIVEGENSNNSNNKKRKNNNTSTSSNTNVDSCDWIGRYDQLDNHIKNCLFTPSPCSFAIHGCDYNGTKKQLDDHYENNCQSHNTMLSSKILSLENSSIMDKKFISQLRQSLLIAETKLKITKRKINKTLETKCSVKVNNLLRDLLN